MRPEFRAKPNAPPGSHKSRLTITVLFRNHVTRVIAVDLIIGSIPADVFLRNKPPEAYFAGVVLCIIALMRFIF